MTLNIVPFWIQIHGMPFNLMMHKVGEAIGNKVGRVIDCEGLAQGIIWSKYLKAIILIDVSEPLYRGTYVNVRGNRNFVALRYECLSDFCFQCGKLDHVERDCPLTYHSTDNNGGRKAFELWLRADGPKMPHLEEIECRVILNAVGDLSWSESQTNRKNKGKEVVQFASKDMVEGGNEVSRNKQFSLPPPRMGHLGLREANHKGDGSGEKEDEHVSNAEVEHGSDESRNEAFGSLERLELEKAIRYEDDQDQNRNIQVYGGAT
ncbi:hypothetical protein ACS0TY_009967 [Phlomoides rotata]